MTTTTTNLAADLAAAEAHVKVCDARFLAAPLASRAYKRAWAAFCAAVDARDAARRALAAAEAS